MSHLQWRCNWPGMAMPRLWNTLPQKYCWACREFGGRTIVNEHTWIVFLFLHPHPSLILMNVLCCVCCFVKMPWVACGGKRHLINVINNNISVSSWLVWTNHNDAPWGIMRICCLFKLKLNASDLCHILQKERGPGFSRTKFMQVHSYNAKPKFSVTSKTEK